MISLINLSKVTHWHCKYEHDCGGDSNNYFTPFLQRHFLRTPKIHAMVWHAHVIEYLSMDLYVDCVWCTDCTVKPIARC